MGHVRRRMGRSCHHCEQIASRNGRSEGYRTSHCSSSNPTRRQETSKRTRSFPRVRGCGTGCYHHEEGTCESRRHCFAHGSRTKACPPSSSGQLSHLSTLELDEGAPLLGTTSAPQRLE